MAIFRGDYAVLAAINLNPVTKPQVWFLIALNYNLGVGPVLQLDLNLPDAIAAVGFSLNVNELSSQFTRLVVSFDICVYYETTRLFCGYLMSVGNSAIRFHVGWLDLDVLLIAAGHIDRPSTIEIHLNVPYKPFQTGHLDC
jgi:hypothetical protein